MASAYWIGINNFLREKDAQDFEQKKIDQARADRKTELEEARKYDRETFLMRANEERKLVLAKLLAERQAKQSAKQTPEAIADYIWLERNLVGAPDELQDKVKHMLAAAQSSPVVATQIKNAVEDARKERRKQGLNQLDVMPSDIINSFAVYGADMTSENVLDLTSLETQIETGNFAGEGGTENFIDIYGQLSRDPTGGAYFTTEYTGDLSRLNNEQRANYQTNSFKARVNSAVSNDIVTKMSSGDSALEAEGAHLKAQLEKFGIEHFYPTYGKPIAQQMLASDDPNMQGIESNSAIFDFFPKEEENKTTTKTTVDEVGSPTEKEVDEVGSPTEKEPDADVVKAPEKRRLQFDETGAILTEKQKAEQVVRKLTGAEPTVNEYTPTPTEKDQETRWTQPGIVKRKPRPAPRKEQASGYKMVITDKELGGANPQLVVDELIKAGKLKKGDKILVNGKEALVN